MKLERFHAPILLATLAIALAAPGARAGEDAAGTTAANFLSVGSGAGIQGRAGATLGLWGDVTMVGWNPGALGWLRETEIALAHATLFEDHTQDYLALGGRVGRTAVRWSLSGLYENEGTFESRDEFNNPTGSFGVSRFAGGGHLAFPLGPNAAFGFGGKWVNENLGDSRGTGATFDLGLQARSGAFGFGAAAQNAFGQMKFSGQTFEFPTNYGAGVAWHHHSGLRVAVDANFPSAYYTDLRGGLEWRWRGLLALRGGYRMELDAPGDEALTGPTFGMGAGVYGVWLDYAYIVPGMGDPQHRIGFTMRPGRMNAMNPYGALSPEYEDESNPQPQAKPADEPVLPVAEDVTPPKPEKAPKPAKPAKVKVEKPRKQEEPRAIAPAEPPANAESQPVVGDAGAAATPPPVAETKPVKAPKPVKAKPAPKPRVEQPKPEPAPVAVAPPATQAPAQPAEPAVRPAKITVKAGETLEMLAKKWGVSVPAFMMDNDMVSTTVRPGQTLKLPAKGR